MWVFFSVERFANHCILFYIDLTQRGNIFRNWHRNMAENSTGQDHRDLNQLCLKLK